MSLGQGKILRLRSNAFHMDFSHLKYPSEFGCPWTKFSSLWNIMRNTIRNFIVTHWNHETLDLSFWMQFLGHVTMEEIVWRASWVPYESFNISFRQLLFVPFLAYGRNCSFSFCWCCAKHGGNNLH